MPGKLSKEFKNDLEEMIDKGPKSFQLLYSIVRDGCDPSIFHRKCDNKGPTITVLYNPKGSIYGFYTSLSWRSSGDWVPDGEHFFFQLQHLGERRFTKCLVKSGSFNVICFKPHLGPFSMAFRTFSEKSNVAVNGVYTLNGSTSISTDYYQLIGGVSAGNLNNGTTEVTDLEVYSVTARCIGFSREGTEQVEFPAESEGQLRTEINAMTPSPSCEFGRFRILVVGPTGAGKSSFINTVASATSGRINQLAICGVREKSITTKYSPYTVETEGEGLGLLLCDTPGIGRESGMTEHAFHLLLGGHVPPDYCFKKPMNLKSPDFISHPEPGDEVHCVAVVVDASRARDDEEEDNNTRRQLIAFMDILHENGTPYAVIASKIDKCESESIEEIAIKDIDTWDTVNTISELYGVPRHNIMPMKNYEVERTTDPGVNILALKALKRLLQLARDQQGGPPNDAVGGPDRGKDSEDVSEMA